MTVKNPFNEVLISLPFRDARDRVSAFEKFAEMSNYPADKQTISVTYHDCDKKMHIVFSFKTRQDAEMFNSVFDPTE